MRGPRHARIPRLAGVAATLLAFAGVLASAGCGTTREATGVESTVAVAEEIDRSELTSCGRLPAVEGFRCGSLEVPKFLADPERGSFEIGFAVRRRDEGDSPAEGTIVAVEGGPGYASTGTANAFVKLFGSLLVDRDLVLIDMRGTGRSEPIDCPDVQSGLAPEWIALAECARRLGDDREAYNTGAAAEDIDAVRRALGLDRITLYGDSYGTFLAQSYAFRHPETLEALVLDGAYPVLGESPWYPSLITSGNENLGVACRRAWGCPPGAGDRLDRLVELMRREGMRVGSLIDVIADAAYGAPASYLRIDRAGRQLLAGNPRPWRQLTLTETVAARDRRQYDRSVELAVGCNDYPMIWDRYAEEPERRAQLELAIREYDVSAFAPFTPREVAIGSEVGYLECLAWPRPTELREPAVPSGAEPTEAPVLVVNGELDDLTTPEEGAMVAELFPSSELYVGRDVGHVDALYQPAGLSAQAIRGFLGDIYAEAGDG